jgi:hypothetical protein
MQVRNQVERIINKRVKRIAKNDLPHVCRHLDGNTVADDFPIKCTVGDSSVLSVISYSQ